MSYLIISDLHLKPNDSYKKIDYLKKLFLKFKNIIIVGDFFEGYNWSFKDIIKNIYFKDLIKIISQKNCVYLIGNHDSCVLKELNIVKKYFKEFDFSYELKIKNQKFLFLHSHKIFPSIDEIFKLYYLPKKITSILLNSIGYYKDHRLRALKYLKLKKIFIEKDTKQLLEIIDKYYFKRNFWVITGHTHNPIILKDKKYANCGFVDYGFASYLTINNQGGLRLHIEKY